MTLFNGANLWVDSADTIMKDIADTPIGDEAWSGGNGGQPSSSASSSASISSSATPEAWNRFTCGSYGEK